MSVLDLILAIALVSFFVGIVGYILQLFTVIPSIILSFITVGIFIALFKFVINR